MTKLIAPIVHRNGSSENMLHEEYSEAAAAIRKAKEAIRKIETHDRSYYVHPLEGAGPKARDQRCKWCLMLDHIGLELAAIHAAFISNEPYTRELRHEYSFVKSIQSTLNAEEPTCSEQ